MNRILSITPYVDVIAYTLESESGLVDQIRATAPHIVILDGSSVKHDQGLISRLLAQRDGLRVIVVSLDNNSLQVYDHQTVRVGQFSDFLSAIYSKTGPLND